MTDASNHLANHLRHLRTTRGLTQARLAEQAGVPRATLAKLESGDANPTLAVLVRVASTLTVSVEELIAPPRASARGYGPSELRARTRQGATIRDLLPGSVPGLRLERMELQPGARFVGVPHTPGTREYLTCEQGRVQLVVSGERYRLSPGHVVIFRGDQKHSYHNPHRATAVAFSVVSFAQGIDWP